LKNYLADFNQKAAAWPAFISSAFPRFHDVYQRASVRNYWGYLGDHRGGTLRETLVCGMTNASSVVQVVTWNDFGEGSMVEPTQEYGYRDLGIIQDCRRKYLEPDFPRNTNDLTLAFRFYNLRRQFSTNALMSAKLDGIFTDIASGRIDTARQELDQLEK